MNLYDDQIKRYSGKGMLSARIRTLLDEDYESIEKMEEEIAEAEKKIKMLKEKQNKLKEMAKRVTPETSKFFKEAREYILKDPLNIPGQMRRYLNIFGKKITRKQFLKECGLE